MIMTSNKTKGRQRVPMVKMTRQSNLQVTFSKRRSGLFKKASELCTLCNAEIAIVVFSPADKVFSFGHPNVDSLVDRFRSGPTGRPVQLADRAQQTNTNTLRDLNVQLTEVANQLEAARKRGEDIAATMKSERDGRWWHNPIDRLEKNQLQQLTTCLDDLKNKVEAQAHRAWASPSLAHHFGPAHQFGPDGDDEFEQKNVLGGVAPPQPSMFPMVPGGMIVPGYNGFCGPHFNPFGMGFF